MHERVVMSESILLHSGTVLYEYTPYLRAWSSSNATHSILLRVKMFSLETFILLHSRLGSSDQHQRCDRMARRLHRVTIGDGGCSDPDENY